MEINMKGKMHACMASMHRCTVCMLGLRWLATDCYFECMLPYLWVPNSLSKKSLPLHIMSRKHERQDIIRGNESVVQRAAIQAANAYLRREAEPSGAAAITKPIGVEEVVALTNYFDRYSLWFQDLDESKIKLSVPKKRSMRLLIHDL
jgi:hypothetical protein